MANIFDETNDRNNDVKQNLFDWSHSNSSTFKFGFIYPILSFLAPPKSSFRIKARAGMQFMPMVFPVQTRMKARFSFFRVPLRTLWKDFKDYVGNFRKGLVEPYHDVTHAVFEKYMGTGKLADYLDVPTTFSGKFGSTSFSRSFLANQVTPVLFNSSDDLAGDWKLAPNYYPTSSSTNIRDTRDIASRMLAQNLVGDALEFQLCVPLIGNAQVGSIKGFTVSDGSVTLSFVNNAVNDSSFQPFLSEGNALMNLITFNSRGEVSKIEELALVNYKFTPYAGGATRFKIELTIESTVFAASKNLYDPNAVTSWLSFTFDNSLSDQNVNNLAQLFVDPDYQSFVIGDDVIHFDSANEEEDDTMMSVDVSYDNMPYYCSGASDANNRIKLSAYRARAYEAIYNAYMRDNRNNPYYIDGEVQYNRWIPTDEGGADSYPYELRRANWEKDFLTTAVPSPQQGQAPLVGLTTYSALNSDGVSELKMALTDEYGKRYAVNYEADDEGIKSVSYAELDKRVATEPLSFRSLVDSSSTGISIPDLRIVNAYQKFLELNMRKGYSYKDIIEGRFDCQVRYDDLNIPEFLGGFTRDISMNRVVQSVERGAAGSETSGNYSDALGSLAGDAFLDTGDTPDITCFCDEESIVMGVLSVVPVANYSQLLPKDYLYADLLDHFQPEFDNLGFQPITYKEVCPVQGFNAGMDLNSVFGYQRPWYEYCQKWDTVHGNMRTNLRNFLINRVFDVAPTLSESFLLVDPEQINDVFAVTEDTDKIIAQIYFDIKAKLPISRVAIPRLD